MIESSFFSLKCADIEFPFQELNSGSLDIKPLAWEWYKTWGTENWEYCYGILNDSMNNIIILGETSYKIVLLKYNRSGELIFNRIVNINEQAKFYSASFSIDSNDNIFIVRKNFLVKVNSKGDILWEKNLAGKYLELCNIITDKTDDLYLTGSISGGLILMKLNNSGEQLWNSTWNSSYGEIGCDIAFDSQNNIFVTGYANYLYDWWDMQENAEIPILKFNSSGNLLWNVTWRSPYSSGGCCGGELWSYSYAFGNSITLDSNDNVYITGFSHRWGLILSYNHSTESFWYSHINVNGPGGDIEVDSDNNIIICFDNWDYGGGDFLLLKCSPKGEQLWNRTWGGSDSDRSLKMLMLSSEEVYVVGSTRSYTNGYRDIALVKFGIDTDNDKISDLNENTLFFTDPFNNDTDDDHLSDSDELFLYDTNPTNNDTDSDLLSDYDELFNYYTDPNNFDTDGDGFSDYDEIFRDMTDPNNSFSSFFTNAAVALVTIVLAVVIFYAIFRKEKNFILTFFRQKIYINMGTNKEQVFHYLKNNSGKAYTAQSLYNLIDDLRLEEEAKACLDLEALEEILLDLYLNGKTTRHVKEGVVFFST